MPEYAKTSWLLFYFPIVIPCFLERVVTYFNVYAKLVVIASRNTRLLFLKRQKFYFFMAESI